MICGYNVLYLYFVNFLLCFIFVDVYCYRSNGERFSEDCVFEFCNDSVVCKCIIKFFFLLLENLRDLLRNFKSSEEYFLLKMS